MWGRKSRPSGEKTEEAEPTGLKAAVRQARIEAAERTGVVVDLRDAETARLELLNEALEPVFAEVPPEIELFDRGITKGDVPRLWIDAIAHVAMGRDKRIYRFVQDTRYGRKVIAESPEISDIVAGGDALCRRAPGRTRARARRRFQSVAALRACRAEGTAQARLAALPPVRVGGDCRRRVVLRRRLVYRASPK